MRLADPQAPGARGYRLLDILVAAWLVLWFALGVYVWHEIRNVDKLTGTLVKTTTALRDTSAALRQVESVPLIGGLIAPYVDKIYATTVDTQQGARDAHSSLLHLSVVAGVAIALVPGLLLLILYVPQRLSWRRTVAEVRRALAENPQAAVLDAYLARRAVLYLDYARLRAISADPWADVGAGDCRTLADAELARLGLTRS
jgi:hypothetical protein